ncbi:aminopeptidase P family protein [Actinocatenispora sera]|uniref:Dipeptidase n=1 Tax=Actinocatenispora sera TaxID=390989 RepID=A0A810L1Q2_9ACTN|nr:aminopeptidase P family protein [Actinocatenispora sera]BCJ28789.1 dipeptidase [Actinocatenispora sera]
MAEAGENTANEHDDVADPYGPRRDRALAAALDAGFAGLIATPGPDLAYLTGYTPTTASERFTALLLTPDIEPTLVVPTLERPDAERVGAAPRYRGWRDETDPYQIVAALLGRAGRYAVSDAAWALHLLALQATIPGAGYTAMTDALPMLRAVKDAAERSRLAAAGAAADAVYERIVETAFAGSRERDVAAALDALLREHGHEQVDFTIVASGPHSANPHHHSGDRIIEAGDTVVLDFGGLRDGYGSDTTRTVHVGEPAAQVREVHELVRTAQQAAFEAVAPGVSCQDVDAVARDIITAAGHGEHFIHRTGHGIGLTTHEPPYIVAGEKQALTPGMCFSLEPGVYLPGRFGVRIEDIVAVTDTGAVRLNNTAHRLQLVG